MKTFHDTNTRRYPRSLADAFPDQRAESGDWVNFHRYAVESAGHRLVLILSIVGVVGFTVWAALGALQ